MIQVNNVVKTFDGFRALDGLTMTVPKGSVYGLVGPNGAGKSTLLRHITGIYRQDSGEVLLEGEPIYENPAAKARVASIPDELYYFLSASTRDMMRFYKGFYPRFDGARYEALKDVFPTINEKQPIRRLSKGMQKQAAFWLALCCRPEVLVLDEPVNGLDPQGIVEIRELLLRLNREHQITILLSSHILDELARLATHYGFLDKGHMLEQISAQKLREKCRACLQLTVDDASRAALALEQRLDTREYEVLPGNVLRLYAFLDRPQVVTAALVEEGVALIGAESKNTDLEDYFLGLIGGVRHA